MPSDLVGSNVDVASRPSIPSRLPMPAPGVSGKGLRVIIAYKAVRAAGSLLAATILGVLLAAHATAPLHAFTAALPRHFEGAWADAVANLLISATRPENLVFVTFVLALDGVLTLLEAWALHRRHWWGPWLVVIATGAFVPFEIVALVRHVHFARIAILALNLVIVAYLLYDRARAQVASRASNAPLRLSIS